MTATVVAVLAAAAVVALWWWGRPGAPPTLEGRSSHLPGVVVPFRRALLGGPLPPTTTLRSTGGTYRLSFVVLPDGCCRAYIVEQPGYGGRSTSLHATHRLRDAQGRLYVCFSPEPRQPDHLVTVVAWWMQGTDAYRHAGTFRAASLTGDTNCVMSRRRERGGAR